MQGIGGLDLDGGVCCYVVCISHGEHTLLWVYKKRQAGDICNASPSKYEMDSNPCYEATAVKQTTDTEIHVYEVIRGGGAKQE